MNKREISFYIHIPFCISKCNYCSFNSYIIANFSEELIERYFKKIIEDIKNYKNRNFYIKSIYFGGGTPSIVNETLIYNVLNEIYRNYSICENCEITLEANPETLNEKKLKNYRNYGINRISIGIQTFNDNLLKFLGRAHNSKKGIKAIELSEKYFHNISIDLIFGIPAQTIDDIFHDINYLNKFNLKHLSYYSLTVEENSKFFNLNVKEIDDELFSQMYDTIIIELNKNNFKQYEISNFSKEGFQCIHNLNYWNYGEYIGFGAGAYSFFNGKRWKNQSIPEKFINDSNSPEFIEKLDKKTMEFEYIFLNLRKKNGINLEDYNRRFNFDFKKKYKNILKIYKNYFKIEDHNLKLNIDGFKISNLIFSDFL